MRMLNLQVLSLCLIWSDTNMIKICENCHSSYKERPSRNKRFCSRFCQYEGLTGESKRGWTPSSVLEISGVKSANFQGPLIEMQGYIWAWRPEHPRANNGRVKRCILIAEKMIGRLLQEYEIVHHINFNRNDDRINNLAVLTKSEHSSYHRREFLNPGSLKPYKSNLIPCGH